MRGDLLSRAASAGVLIEPEAMEIILSKTSPLDYFDFLLTKIPPETAIITPSLLTDDTPKPQVSRPTKPAHRDEQEPSIEITKNYPKTRAKAELGNFVRYFNDRYRKMSSILRSRIELQGAVSITHAKTKGEKVSIIAMVTTTRQTPNGHMIIEVEDPTGSAPVLIMKTKGDLMKKAESLVCDEVVGINGSVGEGIIFCNEIIWPDVPIIKAETKTEDDVAVAFISDIHVGSKKFMEPEFLKMIDWLNGKRGTEEQRTLSRKVAYILVAGDIIDGIGIFPKQDEELAILDIDKQFSRVAEFFELFPENVKIVISPGNHDGVRLPQPQPPLNTITDTLEQDNTLLVSNPAQLKLHDSFDVLMYHGVSFDNMISTVPSLSSGYEQPQKVMEELLRRRHLCPSYGMDIAAEEDDRLVIDKVPDLIHSGHVHTNGYKTYRGVTLLNSGTWQDQTSFQKMVGHTPTPCRLPILSLQDNSLQIINFK